MCRSTLFGARVRAPGLIGRMLLVAVIGCGLPLPASADTAGKATLYSFTGGADGEFPFGLVRGTDGNLYGDTRHGGDFDYGTVYRFALTGALTTLHSFTEAEGFGGLALQASDGNFYGTTGFPSLGTVFRITPSGTYTTIYSFTGGTDGLRPYALVEGPDGNLYGLTSGGEGTLFRLTPGGVLTTLHQFSGTDGRLPHALVVGADGNLYGITIAGGAANGGVIFRSTLAGVHTTLHEFTGADGYRGQTLILGNDGNLYGTTESRGDKNGGTAFKIGPDGTFATLHHFDPVTGSAPGELILGLDGNFYGRTFFGGPQGEGSVFQLTPGGSHTVLFSTVAYGYGKGVHGLAVGADGTLFGTTEVGGSDGFGYGTICRLDPSGPVWVRPPSPEFINYRIANVGYPIKYNFKAANADTSEQVGISAQAIDAFPAAPAPLPEGATLTPGTTPDRATFAWTPTTSQTGQYAFTFVAHDDASPPSETAPIVLTVFVRRATRLTAYPTVLNVTDSGAELTLEVSAKLEALRPHERLEGRLIYFLKGQATYPDPEDLIICAAYTHANGVARCNGGLADVLDATEGYTAVYFGEDEYWEATAHAGIVSVGEVTVP